MMSGLIEKSILDVFCYFSIFNYPPTLEEVHTFLKKRCSRQRLVSILGKMEKKSVVKAQKLEVRSKKLEVRATSKSFITSNFQPQTSNNLTRYTLHQYDKKLKTQMSKVRTNNLPADRQGQQLAINNFTKRHQISVDKLNSWRFRLYIKLLGFIPQTKLIGLSGSVAMLNADENHVIDLFIITAKNRLWTGRFVALVLAQLLGLRRKRDKNNQTEKQVAELEGSPGSAQIGRYSAPRRALTGGKALTESVTHKNKICLNLFFDESNLAVPKFKKTEYVAHEILQMKPLIQKDDIYMRFIDANRWVFDIFPNSKSNIKYQISNIKSDPKLKVQKFGFWILRLICNLLFVIWIFNIIESILKNLQLYFINKHRTSEIVTDLQLWFHPEDFEKKIKDCI